LKKYFAFVALLIIIVFSFTGKENTHPTDAVTQPLVKVQCTNTSIPNFTLDYDADPSEEEIVALCSCLWEKLVGWEKETVIKLTSGEKDKVSTVHMAAFPAIFGKRISECGGEKL
jgi:hypothetical protein